MIKLVIFDLDDTLYPEEQFVKSGFWVVALELSKWTNEPPSKIFSSLERIQRLSSKMVFDRILKEYGIYSSKNVEKLVEIYRAHEPNLTLYEDAEKTIRTLKKRGKKLGLISDGYYYVQKRKVEVLGLESLFDIIVLTDQWGKKYWKPHPRAFKVILENISVKPSESVYVGDNLQKDFLASRKMGIYSIHIKRPSGIYKNEIPPLGGEANIEVKTLEEIINLIELI